MVDVKKKQRGGGTGAAESYSQIAYETEASNYHTAFAAHRIDAHLPLATAARSQDEYRERVLLVLHTG